MKSNHANTNRELDAFEAVEVLPPIATSDEEHPHFLLQQPLQRQRTPIKRAKRKEMAHQTVPLSILKSYHHNNPSRNPSPPSTNDGVNNNRKSNTSSSPRMSPSPDRYSPPLPQQVPPPDKKVYVRVFGFGKKVSVKLPYEAPFSEILKYVGVTFGSLVWILPDEETSMNLALQARPKDVDMPSGNDNIVLLRWEVPLFEEEFKHRALIEDEELGCAGLIDSSANILLGILKSSIRKPPPPPSTQQQVIPNKKPNETSSTTSKVVEEDVIDEWGQSTTPPPQAKDAMGDESGNTPASAWEPLHTALRPLEVTTTNALNLTPADDRKKPIHEHEVEVPPRVKGVLWIHDCRVQKRVSCLGFSLMTPVNTEHMLPQYEVSVSLSPEDSLSPHTRSQLDTKHKIWKDAEEAFVTEEFITTPTPSPQQELRQPEKTQTEQQGSSVPFAQTQQMASPSPPGTVLSDTHSVSIAVGTTPPPSTFSPREPYPPYPASYSAFDTHWMPKADLLRIYAEYSEYYYASRVKLRSACGHGDVLATFLRDAGMLDNMLTALDVMHYIGEVSSDYDTEVIPFYTFLMVVKQCAGRKIRDMHP
eukprot:PhF_6_TR13918/c0_g1_i1/m.22379